LLGECAKGRGSEILPGSDQELIIENLKRTPAGLDPILAKTVPHKIAYHHAGLSVEEREILEAGFRKGHLKILAATSTLASGVNLPARRVIFQSPYIGRSFLDPIHYYQMTGRAGRKNQDELGESFLIYSESDKKKAIELVRSSLQPLKSSLEFNKQNMNRAVLELVVTRRSNTKDDLLCFLKHTFFAHCKQNVSRVSNDDPSESINFLLEKEFITLSVNENSKRVEFSPTKLGAATVSSALSPEEGVIVYEELCAALKAFVLENELHLVRKNSLY
jgi:DNA polymerase theta